MRVGLVVNPEMCGIRAATRMASTSAPSAKIFTLRDTGSGAEVDSFMSGSVVARRGCVRMSHTVRRRASTPLSDTGPGSRFRTDEVFGASMPPPPETDRPRCISESDHGHTHHQHHTWIA